jgi:hypothetical protein
MLKHAILYWRASWMAQPSDKGETAMQYEWEILPECAKGNCSACPKMKGSTICACEHHLQPSFIEQQMARPYYAPEGRYDLGEVRL